MDHRAEADTIASRFEATWNAHDMDAFAALFDPDATFVNRYGAFSRGREAIAAAHRAIHATIYRDSVLRCRLLGADRITDGVVTGHILSRLDAGPAHPAGAHRADTLMLAVLTRRDGTWRIQAAENVTLVDPATGAPRFVD